jgi:D-3-phosphoglycerate dehydrogenase
MGRAFAQRLSGFEASMIAYDKYKKKYSDSFVKETDMETIFREAHILSLHVPLTEETYYMVDYEFLSRFRNPIILINTSRGHVVKTADLVTCLKNKKVIAAALDVLEYEPHSFETLDAKNLPDDFAYLQKSDNVLLTPHVAGWTTESKIKLAQVLADKIRTLNLTS